MRLNPALLFLVVPLALGIAQAQNSYQLGSQRAPLFQPAQQDQSQASPGFVRPSAQNSSQEPAQLEPVPQFQQRQGMLYARGFRAQQDLPGLNSHMCLALRVYHFERNDGNAPVLVKTLTCTPNTVFLKRAGPPPKGPYMPL